MKKMFCTLVCAAVATLLGSSPFVASAAATPLLVPTGTSSPLNAVWMPDHVLRTLDAVQVSLHVPESGGDSAWNITFASTSGGPNVYFTTDSFISPNSVLGYVPEGVYDVYFDQDFGSHDYFEYTVGCDQTSTSMTNHHGNVYNAHINSGCQDIYISVF